MNEKIFNNITLGLFTLALYITLCYFYINSLRRFTDAQIPILSFILIFISACAMGYSANDEFIKGRRCAKQTKEFRKVYPIKKEKQKWYNRIIDFLLTLALGEE